MTHVALISSRVTGPAAAEGALHPRLLRPRHIGYNCGMSPRHRNVQRKEQPAACPFCEAPIPRPVKLDPTGPGQAEGGRCVCGAVFVTDVTGKLGGQALVDGLTLLAGGDQDRGLALRGGVDYELKKVGYRPRTHSLEPRMPRGGGAFGLPKLFFFRLANRSAAAD